MTAKKKAKKKQDWTSDVGYFTIPKEAWPVISSWLSKHVSAGGWKNTSDVDNAYTIAFRSDTDESLFMASFPAYDLSAPPSGQPMPGII